VQKRLNRSIRYGIFTTSKRRRIASLVYRMEPINKKSNGIKKLKTKNQDASWDAELAEPKKSPVRWGPDLHMGRGNFEAKGMLQHALRHFDVSCAKTAEPIEILFELWTRVGPRKHYISWRSTAAMRVGNFWGKDTPGHARRHCRELCKNG